MEIWVKYQENNMASILKKIVSNAFTTDRKRDKLVNIFLQ